MKAYSAEGWTRVSRQSTSCGSTAETSLFESHWEANMDVQWAEAIACPTPLIFYSTLGGEASLKWLNYVLSQPKVPQTISTSYISFEQDYAKGHTTSLCELFAELGTRGACVIFLSGDSGVDLGDCDGSGSVQSVPTFPCEQHTRADTDRSPRCHALTGTVPFSLASAEQSITGTWSRWLTLRALLELLYTPGYQNSAVPLYLLFFGSRYDGLYSTYKMILLS